MEDRSQDTGSRVRILRRSKELSQLELAYRVGHSQQWLSKVESGLTRLSLPDTVALARALDVDIAQLVDMPQEHAS